MYGKLLATFFTFLCFNNINGLNITFSGRDLPAMDIFNGAPDAYVNVYYAPNVTAPYEFVGRTDDISDEHNPDWPEVYTFTYLGGGSQRLKIDMYDADSPDSDDYMGFVEIALIDVLTASGGVAERNLIGGSPGGGQLLIRGN